MLHATRLNSEKRKRCEKDKNIYLANNKGSYQTAASAVFHATSSTLNETNLNNHKIIKNEALKSDCIIDTYVAGEVGAICELVALFGAELARGEHVIRDARRYALIKDIVHSSKLRF